MYAVFGISKLNFDSTEAATQAAEGLAANLSQAQGFVSATIARSGSGSEGRSMILFETEEAAKAAAANAASNLPAGAPVEILSLDVFEVVATR